MAKTCPACGGTQEKPRGREFEPGATICEHPFHGEHSCWTCMNGDICKGYRNDLPIFCCRDWEADDE